MSRPLLRILATGLLFGATFPALADTAILNAGYDVTRELYREINPGFVANWKQASGETLVINQSHGGSSKQARSVADGLEADVVTMNQETDIDILVQRGVVAQDWKKRLPDNAAPYYSTIVFLVRKGNPKRILDWEDLGRAGVQVIVRTPRPRATGATRTWRRGARPSARAAARRRRAMR